MCLIDVSSELLGQRLVVHSHLVSVGSAATSRHGDPRERRSRLVAFFGQPRDDADGGIVLVEGIGQLVACLRQLLLELEGLEGQGVPLVLEGRQEGGDGGQGGRPRAHDAGGLDGQEVFEVELIAGDGVLAVLLDVLLDQPLLENSARLLRNDRLLGSLT